MKALAERAQTRPLPAPRSRDRARLAARTNDRGRGPRDLGSPPLLRPRRCSHTSPPDPGHARSGTASSPPPGVLRAWPCLLPNGVRHLFRRGRSTSRKRCQTPTSRTGVPVAGAIASIRPGHPPGPDRLVVASTPVPAFAACSFPRTSFRPRRGQTKKPPHGLVRGFRDPCDGPGATSQDQIPPLRLPHGEPPVGVIRAVRPGDERRLAARGACDALRRRDAHGQELVHAGLGHTATHARVTGEVAAGFIGNPGGR